MPSKKQTNQVGQQRPSASSLSTAASTHQANSSVIQKAAFAPSTFQLSLFASVIQGLNGQQLRVHDTVSGQLQCQYDTHTTRVTCLDWGHHGDAAQLPERKANKKKRRFEEANGIKDRPGDVVLALGTNKSDIQLFSPTSSKVVASLTGGHKTGVKAFKFANHGLGNTAWSLGADKRLVQWNLREHTAVRNIEQPASPPSALLPLSSCLLVASHETWLIDLTTKKTGSRVGSGANPIHTIYADLSPEASGRPSKILTAAQDERQILVHDTQEGHMSLLTLNAAGDVESLAISESDEGDENKYNARPRALAVITKRGELELFADPFQDALDINGDVDRKSKLKGRTRKPIATVSISHGDGQNMLPLASAHFHDDELVIACVESGGNLAFERLPWLNSDSNEILMSGTFAIERAKSIYGAENATRTGAKLVGLSQVDESRATVTYGRDEDPEAMAVDDEADHISISSAEEDESDSDEEEVLPNGIDASMQGIHVRESGSSDHDFAEGSRFGSDAEPTFGDLLQSTGPRTIDVATQLQGSEDKTLVPYGRDIHRTPTGLSLTNVLGQALRTSDVSLLESCFHEQDLNVVRATIERLDSSLASVLLQRLAEKLHSRPGRAGSLMVWIQWTLVSHGGYLGSQPDAIKKLASLQRVVKERANSLQPLLSLKGKLDMLEAQMNLRRSVLSRAQRDTSRADQEDANLVYVEASKDSDMSASASDEEVDESELDEDDDLDMDGDSEVSEEDDSDASKEGRDAMIDAEASEADSDEEVEEEVDYDDVDSADDMSDDDGAAFSGKFKLPNGTR